MKTVCKGGDQDPAMIHELDSVHYRLLRPLFDPLLHHAVVSAVLSGSHPGRVLVDHPAAPGTAFLSPSGRSQPFGPTPRGAQLGRPGPGREGTCPSDCCSRSGMGLLRAHSELPRVRIAPRHARVGRGPDKDTGEPPPRPFWLIHARRRRRRAALVGRSQRIMPGMRIPTPPGKLVQVGDQRFHVHRTGQGSPTVVVDAGAGDWSLGWMLVQARVAEFTRICTYDRAGLGWSDPGAKPRDSRRMAGKLYRLLTSAEIPAPYLLVGHSLGGQNVRMYASQHPEQVAALVLVDAPPTPKVLGPAEPASEDDAPAKSVCADRTTVVRAAVDL